MNCWTLDHKKLVASNFIFKEQMEVGVYFQGKGLFDISENRNLLIITSHTVCIQGVWVFVNHSPSKIYKTHWFKQQHCIFFCQNAMTSVIMATWCIVRSGKVLEEYSFLIQLLCTNYVRCLQLSQVLKSIYLVHTYVLSKVLISTSTLRKFKKY